jgi:uncharacterized DUF497 family protein
VRFEWDRRKAAINLKKHGIDFAEAAMVFYDELAITIQDAVWDEERYVTIGMDAVARILVVHTHGGGIALDSYPQGKRLRESARNMEVAYEE